MRHRGSAVLRPSPIGPTIERIGESANFLLLRGLGVEIGTGRQGAGQQEGAIDRRQFAVPGAPACLHVEEMIVEAAMAGGVGLRSLRAVPEETQGGQSAVHRDAARHKSALDTYRIGGERQPGGGDAGGPVLRGLVEDQSVGRVHLV